MNMVESGRYAEDLIFVFLGEKMNRLNLIAAKKFRINKKGLLLGDQIALISHTPSKDTEFDNLLIDNQMHSITHPALFSELTTKKKHKLSAPELSLKPLVKRTLSKNRKKSRRSFIEIEKRISLALSTFTFTLLGLTFGMHIGRSRNRFGILIMSSMASMAFIAFLMARSMASSILISSVLYILPHPIIAYTCLKRQSRLKRGIE